MDALPLPALQLVLRFALDDFSDAPTARTTSVCAPALQQLATVSRHWYAAMLAVLDAHRQSTRAFTLVNYSSKVHDAAQQNRGASPNDMSSSRADNKVNEQRPALALASLSSPPSSRIAQSVANFFSAIVCKARAERAFPWGDDDTEQAVAPVDTSNSDTFALEPAPASSTTESAERALERHLVQEVQRVATSLLATDNGSAARRLVELRLREPDASLDSTSDAAQPDSRLRITRTLQREWHSVFRCCPNLQRLDVAGVALLSPHLPAVLDAASTHCLALRTLVLPQQECLGYQRRNVQPAFDALYAALTAWSTAASAISMTDISSSSSCTTTNATITSSTERSARRCRQRGLQRLVMPKLFAYEFYDEHMTRIAQTCGALEHVDGLRLAPIFQARGLSHHAVMGSWLLAWTAFCRGCPHLRTWDWFAIPFIDAFFAVFAAEPKRALRTLTLPGNTTLWKRDYVFEAHQAPDCRCSPDGMRALLRACPELTTLDVLFSDRHLLFGTTDAPFLIGDAFIHEVVRACPLLETLRLVEAAPRHGFEATNAITAAGVAALAALAHLHVVELSGVALSADALFILATQRNAATSCNCPRRRVRATVGVRAVRKADIVATYSRLVTELLEQLLQRVRDASTNGIRTSDTSINSNGNGNATCELPRFELEVRIDTANHQLPVRWATPFRRDWMALRHELLARHCGATLSVAFDFVRAVAVIRSGR